MKLKKFVSIIAALAITSTVAVGLSGCGGGDEAGNGENVQLTWIQLGDKPADHDLVMAEANKIIQAEIGATLDLQYIDSASFAQKMKLKMASGEPYDICFTGYANNYLNAVEMGGLYDITELVEEVGMNEAVADYYLEAARVDGKIYAIPNVQVMSHPSTIVIETALAEEIGVDVDALSQARIEMDSFEDFKAWMDGMDKVHAKIKAARPDKYTMLPLTYESGLWEPVLNNVVFKRYDGSNKLVLNYETEEYQYANKKVREWYNAGYIRKDVASLTNEGVTAESKRTYCLNQSSWKPGQEISDMKTYEKPQSHIFMHAPYMARENPLATMIGVGANTKNPKKAVEFIKLINSNEELFNLICFGIEGTHYTKNEDGTVKEIEGSGYAGVGTGAWKYGNQFNAYVIEGQPADVWEQTEKMNDESIKSPLLGFVLDTSMIATEVGNMSNVDSEYRAKRMGTADPEEWYDEYCAAMDKAGAHKVLDEIQRQYDEFLASK